MTKREIEKCENLMHEAIRYAKESKEELEKAMSEKDKTEREILHSKGVQHYGYAHGINQALVELGFKHEKMKELYPMRRKTPCFSYGDIRRVHRIYASN